MNWVYLLAGLGLGFVGGRLFKKTNDSSSFGQPETGAAQAQSALADELARTKVAYQMAVEMSQFKAGFLARTSHELRSPLNGLIGMHQLILSDLCDDPAEERDFLAQANQSALKMVKVLDEILDVAKVQHGTAKLVIQPVQLVRVFQEIEQLIHLQAQNRNFKLRIASIDPDLYVLADPHWFKQALLNLADTAIAHMQDGQMTISAQVIPEAEMVKIWIEAPFPLDLWQESLTLLTAEPEQETPLSSLPNQRSPGMTLLLVQTLLERMQGGLELVARPNEPEAGSSPELPRLECRIPLATE